MKRFWTNILLKIPAILTGITIVFVHVTFICPSQRVKNTSGLADYAGFFFIDPVIPDNKTLV